MRNIQIVAEEIYHVYNRGVDQRKIFMEDKDYQRFIHDLFEFNDENNALNAGFRFNLTTMATRQQYNRPRKLLVEILAFALMPNHYHLFLKPKKDSGVAEFMKKVNGGYAQYFNQKYDRSGVLFQGRFRAVLVKRDTHFMHLPYYIHANPLDLYMPEWRDGKLKDFMRAYNFLENYRWSSFPDYVGKKNYPSVTQREFLLDIADGTHGYKNSFLDWLRAMNLDAITDITLENYGHPTAIVR